MNDQCAYIHEVYKNREHHEQYTRQVIKDGTLPHNTIFKASKYGYHPELVCSIIHKVYVGHNSNGYHFAINLYNKLEVILQNIPTLVNEYKIGNGKIFILDFEII